MIAATFATTRLDRIKGIVVLLDGNSFWIGAALGALAILAFHYVVYVIDMYS